MSYRVCTKCDFVFNNRFYQEDEVECPDCGSYDKLSPLDDDRDWERLYKEQRKEEVRKVLQKFKDEQKDIPEDIVKIIKKWDWEDLLL